MDNLNNIFEFILDYFKTKKIDKSKYNNFLNEYNVYNLYKIAIQFHYDFLTYYLYVFNFYCDKTEILRNLINLEIKIKNFYKCHNLVIPKFNLFILTNIKKNFCLKKKNILNK